MFSYLLHGRQRRGYAIKCSSKASVSTTRETPKYKLHDTVAGQIKIEQLLKFVSNFVVAPRHVPQGTPKSSQQRIVHACSCYFSSIHSHSR